jgi:hypothetical protein
MMVDSDIYDEHQRLKVVESGLYTTVNMKLSEAGGNDQAVANQQPVLIQALMTMFNIVQWPLRAIQTFAMSRRINDHYAAMTLLGLHQGDVPGGADDPGERLHQALRLHRHRRQPLGSPGNGGGQRGHPHHVRADGLRDGRLPGLHLQLPRPRGPGPAPVACVHGQPLPLRPGHGGLPRSPGPGQFALPRPAGGEPRRAVGVPHHPGSSQDGHQGLRPHRRRGAAHRAVRAGADRRDPPGGPQQELDPNAGSHARATDRGQVQAPPRSHAGASAGRDQGAGRHSLPPRQCGRHLHQGPVPEALEACEGQLCRQGQSQARGDDEEGPAGGGGGARQARPAREER